MGDKTRKKKKQEIEKKSALTMYIIIALIALLAGAGGSYVFWGRAVPESSSGQKKQKAFILSATPRNPRPTTLSPFLFSGRIAEAYQVARKAPELLEQMPCYCGCYQGNGHQSNLDCYIDRHGAG